MPRIDPLQLLTCLSVLLSPEGGISSPEEVPRLVNLMSKFSKKLVSKCVYILILKNSKSHLVNMFMTEGGWNLIQSWLQDAMQISNWNLVNEILALLLTTPVDVERLKLNNIPKLVKNLSRRDDLEETQKLSSQLVQHWLVIVKSSNPPATSEVKGGADTKIEPKQDVAENHVGTNVCDTVDNKADVVVQIDNENNTAISTGTFYKVSVRDGKQIISKLVAEVVKNESEEERKSHKSSKPSSGSKKISSGSRSSSSKHRSSSSSSSKSSTSSKDKSRDKDRRDRDKDKDRHRNSNGALKSSSKSSSSGRERKDSKEKQAERDKDTLTKIKPQSIDKLGRIPKKPSDDKKENKEVKRKPTMSIQERKSNEERPKTVKVFNSKMRSTGLEEEAKPPPPRPLKKPAVQLPAIPTKRPSPNRETVAAPPEKKIRVELPERPGSIKLIPPKPKPAVLQESDIFMDALTASATAKKEPKKRKRRASLTKETPTSPTTTGGDQPTTNSSPTATSPLGLKNIAPINFYQDTLTEETIMECEDKERDVERNNERCITPTDDDEEALKNEKIYKADGVKGVLLYAKKKGPKRSIQWKNEADLVEVRYFELDETERVNVTKTFMDMAKMDISSEREALQNSRKLPNEDLMEPQAMWRLLFLIDQPDALVQPGSKSLEKDIQFAREKSVLQALYFDKRKIPDSPDEPMPENHQMSDPVMIPLEDADSQEIDLRNTPWPEPKGSPPHIESQLQPQVFPNLGGQFNTSFPQMPPPAFQNMQPRFNGPGNFGPPNIMPNGNIMGPNMGPPHDLINPQGQNIFGPGGPDGGGFQNENTSNFPLPFNPPNNMNMNFIPPNNFNMNRPMMNRGGFRRGGGNNNNGPWVRMSGPGPGGMGPNNWNRGGGGHHRGGGGGGGRMCKNIKNHGYCRNRDNCPFMHP